jgi:hypothetical protein
MAVSFRWNNWLDSAGNLAPFMQRDSFPQENYDELDIVRPLCRIFNQFDPDPIY